MALASRHARADEARAFAEEFYAGAPVRLVEDADGTISDRLGVDYHPLYLLLDAQGRPEGPPTTDPIAFLAGSA